MTPRNAFGQARELLMRAHGDPDRASLSFRWPELDAFNWTTHWFDEFADGNRQPAVRVVTDNGGETVSFGELSDELIGCRYSSLMIAPALWRVRSESTVPNLLREVLLPKCASH